MSVEFLKSPTIYSPGTASSPEPENFASESDKISNSSDSDHLFGADYPGNVLAPLTSASSSDEEVSSQKHGRSDDSFTLSRKKPRNLFAMDISSTGSSNDNELEQSAEAVSDQFSKTPKQWSSDEETTDSLSEKRTFQVLKGNESPEIISSKRPGKAKNSFSDAIRKQTKLSEKRYKIPEINPFFDGSVSQPITKKKGPYSLPECPSAPQKPMRVVETEFTPYALKAQKLARLLPQLHLARPGQQPAFELFFKIGSARVTVSKVLKKFSSGNFSDVYLVQGTGLINKTFVLKILKEKWRNGRTPVFSKIVRDEFHQYPRLKERFPGQIATHYDLELILQENPKGYNAEEPAASLTHGCHFVEYVPNAYPVSNSTTSLARKGTAHRKADDALKALFKAAYEYKDEPFDLQRNNVGFDLKGNLKVFDPMFPETFVGEDEEKFKYVVNQALQSFAPLHSERFNYLDPRLDLQ